MAPPSIWDTRPGLRDYLQSLVAEGLKPPAIRDAIRAQYGLTITTGNIWQQIKRMESSWATRTADLVTPAGGYATPLDSPGPLHIHVKGWEPRVEIVGDEAVGITDVVHDELTLADEDTLIRGWGLDPAHWRIIPPLSVNKWQTTVKTGSAKDASEELQQKWNYQFKAKLARREKHPDLAPLIEEIAKYKPRKSPELPDGSGASLVVCWSDTQMGKGDGDGAEGTMRRCLEKIDAFAEYAQRMKKRERIDSLYVFGMGDLIESCDSHYAQQTFRADLNLRDQVKVMRRLIAKSIERWAPLFPRVVVSCVGGNHGEVRRDGKSYTDFADNHDVAIFEQLAEAFERNAAAFGHVSWHIPKDDLSLTFDVSGVVVGITHGHVAGKGSSGMPQKKLLDWWAKQAHGMQPIGDATILISGHYHHFSTIESGAKTHIQCPALEGGSDWWRNLSGQQSRPGLLTLVVGKGVSPAGYKSLEVL